MSKHQLCIAFSLISILAACGGGTTSGGERELAVPSVIAQASDAQVTQGQSANFSISAHGGALSYQWYKDSQVISGATQSTYTTPSLSSSDSGAKYHVVIRNDLGSINGKVATLIVLPAPAAKINDTGVRNYQCLKNDALVDCATAGTFAQDGQVGRDVSAITNSDGSVGFSFLKISNTGNELESSAPNWSCVKDLTTGLMWEVKTSANKNDTFTHWDDIDAYQKTSPTGGPAEKPTRADIDLSTNSLGYVKNVNNSALCGFTDWRLPMLEELQGLVDYGSSTSPKIDKTWFPNSVDTITWTSSKVSNDEYVLIADFRTGLTAAWARNQFKSIRLVRGELPSSNRFSSAMDTDGMTPILIDLHTKLVWRSCFEGETWNGSACTGSATEYAFNAALERAKEEAFAKGKKWRLPNAKELISLGDKRARSFGNSSLWSATPYLEKPSQPIIMRQGWGILDSWYTSSYVLLVRDNE